MEQLGPAVIQIGLMDNSDTLQNDLAVTFMTSDIVGGGNAQGKCTLIKSAHCRKCVN